MPSQHLNWTALPFAATKAASAADSKLHLSVFLTPRLTGTVLRPSLGQFPDFWSLTGGWPSTVGGLGFRVEFRVDGTTTTVGATAVVSSAAPEDALWRKLFKSTTPVSPPTFKSHLDRTVLSYRADQVMALVKDQYRAVAEKPELLHRLPDADRLIVAPSLQNPPLVGARGILVQAQDVQAQDDRSTRDAPLPRQVRVQGLELESIALPQMEIVATPSTQFQQFRAFHEKPKVPPDVAPRPQIPTTDFHKALSSLTNYRDLMRRLGIVVDLEVPLSLIAANFTAKTGRVRVIAQWTRGHSHGTGVTHEDAYPWTRFRLDWAKRDPFLVAPRTTSPQIRDGELLLRSSSGGTSDPFAVLQVDVDAAAMAFLSTSANLLVPPRTTRTVRALDAGDSGDASGGTDAAAADVGAADVGAAEVQAAATDLIVTPAGGEASLPALRTVAPTLYQRNVDSRFRARQQRAKDLHKQIVEDGAFDSAELFAEDVTQGYRIDVWDDQSGKWHTLCARRGRYILDGAPVVWDGEGETHADEGFIEQALTLEPRAAGGADSTSAVRIHEMMFGWDGWSLVASRPGVPILNGVDAAGNTRMGSTEMKDGRPYDVGHWVDPAFPLDTRFVAAPGTLPRLRFGRKYRFRARAVDAAGNSIPFRETDTDYARLAVSSVSEHKRYEPISAPMVIPKTPFGLAESVTHIVVKSDFNTAPGKINASERHIVPPKTSVQMAEQHGGFDKTVGGQSVVDKAVWPLITTRDHDLTPMGQTATPVASIPSPLPYLPDYLSRGAAFKGLPGAIATSGDKVQAAAIPMASLVFSGINLVDSGTSVNVTTTKVSFETGGAWHERMPFILKVVGAEATDKRVAHHSKPAAPKWDPDARVLTVQLPKAEQITVDLSSYVDGDSAGKDVDKLGVIDWSRERLSATSTTRSTLDRLAAVGSHWMVTPPEKLTLVHAVKHPLIAPAWTSKKKVLRSAGETFATITDEMAICGKSTTQLDLMATWREVVDDVSKPRWERVEHATSRAFGVEIERDDTIALKGTAIAERKLQRHHFGDTKRRTVIYHGVATSRYRDYFVLRGTPAPPGDDGFVRVGDAWKTTVPSSARPPAPKVAFLMPSFEHTSPSSTSKRRRGGIRVYLERPWFASGDQEKLGIVYWKPAYTRTGFLNTTAFNQVRSWVSEWGADPIWRSANLPSDYVSASSFPGSVTRDGLQLAEKPPLKIGTKVVASYPVSVAGYPVNYDEEREMWFADIRMETGSAYFPFVRFALARYQSASVSPLHLSPVVMCDFIQTVPDRLLSATQKADGSEVTVALSGGTYSSSGYGFYKSQIPSAPADKRLVEAFIERRPTTVELDWTVIGSKYELVPPTLKVAYAPGYVTVKVPIPTRSPGYEYRLQVREYERHAGRSAATDTDGKVAETRLVYAETLPL